MALPLVLKTESRGLTSPRILKVVDGAEFVRNGWEPGRSVLLIDKEAPDAIDGLLAMPWAAVMTADVTRPLHGRAVIRHPEPKHAVSPGDIIEVAPDRPSLRVLYRRGDNGNVLFATERCNSFCLMCSQPPRKVQDDWRVRQNVDLISLIDRDEPSLAITGGEPTLLDQGLVEIIAECRLRLPDTDLQVLTNGRKFASGDLAKRVEAAAHAKLQWNVPLYADVAPVHDYIVQAKGAFHETVAGLYRLAEANQAIEIRVVLHKPSIARLEALSHFIYRNLTFVRHIALMGMEPTGFARANRDALWIDPVDYIAELEGAVRYLNQRGMRVSLYNLPLCILPKSLWRFAAKSISDWKNIYVPECDGCAVREKCAGFFQSASKEWLSRGIRPIKKELGPKHVFESQESV